MQIVTTEIEVSSKGNCDIIDLTYRVQEIIQESGLREGSVLLFVAGATAGLTTIEYEPGLKKDYPEFFERIAPANRRYHHDDTWNDGNGHSHIRASLQGPSLQVPFTQSKLLLGIWQQIVLIDFDTRPRTRKLIIQLTGTLS